MNVTSAEDDDDIHDHVVIMLHGEGQSGDWWKRRVNDGWFGKITGFKYVFPTS